EAVFVQRSDVSGLEPAIGKSRFRFLRHVPVAFENGGAFHQDLAILGNLQLQAVMNLAYRADPECAAPVHRERGRGLRETVALHDGASYRAEPLRHVFTQGCAAGKIGATAPAKAGTNLFENQFIGQSPREAGRLFTARDLVLVAFANVHGPVEDLALQSVS